jgi:CHAD domain-containing protein
MADFRIYLVVMPISQAHVRRIFQKLDRDILKLADESGDSVHSFRTSTRRLQTLLDQLLPKRDRNQKKLLKTLLHIRKRAGKIRDLDVQLAALRSLKTPQEPRRKTQLMHRLIELHEKHDRKLRKSLKQNDISDLRKRLKRAGKAIELASVHDPLSTAQQMLGQLARPQGPVPEELLHQYRMVCKRARYVAEFAAKSPESDQLIAQLKRAQDALGGWHDWLLLTETAAKRLGDVGKSSLVAVLHNVTRAKFRRAVAALPITTEVATQLPLKARALPESADKPQAMSASAA